MKFDLNKAREILQQTPALLSGMLKGLSDEWILNNEGAETWSPYDIVGHLIHGEKTDWIPRMEIFLSDSPDKTFEPFDRFAQFKDSKGKSLEVLLDEFEELRKHNLELLTARKLTEKDLQLEATHPELGKVHLSELLAAWVVHDLNHIGQIARVMAHQYRTQVGPWQEYMGILQGGNQSP